MSELSVRLKLAEEAIEKLNTAVFGTTKDEPVKEAESNDLLGLDLKETKSESSEEGGVKQMTPPGNPTAGDPDIGPEKNDDIKPAVDLAPTADVPQEDATPTADDTKEQAPE